MEKTDFIGGLYGFRTGKPPWAFGILLDHHLNLDDPVYFAFHLLASYTNILPKYICLLTPKVYDKTDSWLDVERD